MQVDAVTSPSEAPAAVPPAPLRPSVWAILRAVAIFVVLGIWILSALPGRPYDQARLESKRGARLVGSIDRGLRKLGIPSTREHVASALIGTTKPLIDARNALYQPLRPALDAMALGQRWGLFLQNGRTGYRMQLEARTANGEFQLLYRPHREDVLGLESALAFRRLRGIYSPTSRTEPRAQYEGFVGWLAERVFALEPSYQEVRVSMERVHLGSPGDPPRSLSIEHVAVRARGGAT